MTTRPAAVVVGVDGPGGFLHEPIEQVLDNATASLARLRTAPGHGRKNPGRTCAGQQCAHRVVDVGQRAHLGDDADATGGVQREDLGEILPVPTIEPIITCLPCRRCRKSGSSASR
jgi:hypothetical protein